MNISQSKQKCHKTALNYLMSQSTKLFNKNKQKSALTYTT